MIIMIFFQNKRGIYNNLKENNTDHIFEKRKQL